MKTSRTQRAFTLIELLVVVAIIASLAGLLMPSISAAIQKANSVACVGNLRQIGISAQLYANDHQQTTPLIEPWPGSPVYAPGDGAQTMLAALSPYGVTQATLQCKTDMNGPNYYAKEGNSSYEWCPMANGQNVQSVKLVWGGNMGPTITLSNSPSAVQ